MAAYVPAIIWLFSAIICYYIAKVRHVRPNIFWTLVAVILGPLAIPLIFFAKPEQKIGVRQDLMNNTHN